VYRKWQTIHKKLKPFVESSNVVSSISSWNVTNQLQSVVQNLSWKPDTDLGPKKKKLLCNWKVYYRVHKNRRWTYLEPAQSNPPLHKIEDFTGDWKQWSFHGQSAVPMRQECRTFRKLSLSHTTWPDTDSETSEIHFITTQLIDQEGFNAVRLFTLYFPKIYMNIIHQSPWGLPTKIL